MRTLTHEEAESWMIHKSVDLNMAGYNHIQTEAIPNDSGKKNYLARELSNLEYGNECLLNIDEYGIWPSSENIELFEGYRKSIGIDENLTEKPAHLIAYSEKTELYCLLCMVLYFCWGALLITENANEIIRISHDECIDLLIKGNKKNTFISEFNAIFKICAGKATKFEEKRQTQ
jgi:hypothetical protein